MLQKIKVTSYAIIYFLVFGFSFIAFQVTTGVAEAQGGCIPVERIRGHSQEDLTLWIERCLVSGSKGTCGNSAEWPNGDAGRCEMRGCVPVERIRNHPKDDYNLWVERCQVSGSKGTCGNSAEWPNGDGGTL